MKILITGSSGMVGKNLVAALQTEHELLTPRHNELELTDQMAVVQYVEQHKPDMVIHLAAVVGGIQANINEPVRFLIENNLMSTHIIQASVQAGVKQFINLGSSCMYPKDREILPEEDLLTGKLEPTNEGYALAKISASLLCDYVSRQYGYTYKNVIPCNLYGPYDNFDPVRSHLIPAVIRKIHQAKQNQEKTVEIWGDGKARREFMHVGDLVRFLQFAVGQLDRLPDHVNVGLGADHTINEYYQIAAEVIGYQGDFSHDISKPVGMLRKRLDVSRAKQLGWQANIALKDGLQDTYDYFLNLIAESV